MDVRQQPTVAINLREQVIPYIEQVLYAPPLPKRVANARVPYDGLTDDFFKPLRDMDTDFPKGYREMMARLVVGFGIYAVMSEPDYSHGPYGPHTVTRHNWLHGRVPGIYIPRAAQFDSDTTAWHALFHEGAHVLNYKKIPGMFNRRAGNQRGARALTEGIADAAAYAGMVAVGLPDDLSRAAGYVQGWMQGVPMPPQGANLAAGIAAELAAIYTHVQQVT